MRHSRCDTFESHQMKCQMSAGDSRGLWFEARRRRPLTQFGNGCAQLGARAAGECNRAAPQTARMRQVGWQSEEGEEGGPIPHSSLTMGLAASVERAQFGEYISNSRWRDVALEPREIPLSSPFAKEGQPVPQSAAHEMARIPILISHPGTRVFLSHAGGYVAGFRCQRGCHARRGRWGWRKCAHTSATSSAWRLYAKAMRGAWTSSQSSPLPTRLHQSG